MPRQPARRIARRALGLTSLVAAAASCATPQPAASPTPILGPASQLSFAGARTGEGYFDASGRHLVFQSEREPGNPFYQIYWMELAGGDTRRLSTGVGKTTCGWAHPDGARVLFASTHLDPEAVAKQEAELAFRASGEQRRYAWDYDPHYDLFFRHLGSDRVERLTDAPGYDAEGAISPDGRSIVFTSNRHVFGPDGETILEGEARRQLEADPSLFMDLYRLDLDDRSLSRLTETPGYDGGAFFSPDGTRIVWRRFSEDGLLAEIYTMRADGSDVRAITRMGAMSWAPFWHPSGDYVVFATNRHGFSNFELYLVDARGANEPVRLTESEGFDGLPAFAPDGSTLVWTSGRGAGGRSQLFRASFSDAAARAALGLEPELGEADGPRGEALLPLPANARPAIDAGDLREIVARLTDDATAGRLTGTPGERLAAGYVARRFRQLGLEPAGDDGSYFQEFEFTAGVSAGDDNRLEADGQAWTVDTDWRPLAFSRIGALGKAPVVFGGYGIVAPAEGSHPRRDDLAELDLQGKWLLVLRYVPDDLPHAQKQRLRPYSGLRYKAMLARDRGARGLLVASGPRAKVREQLVALQADGSLGATSIGALSISDTLAEALVARGGHDLAVLQQQLDQGEELAGFETGASLAAHVDLVQEKRRGRNVLARLRATTSAPASPLPAIMLGAHLDHLGRGEGHASLARGDARGAAIHPGADDNASGVAVVLEIAEALANDARRGRLDAQRDLWFAAWSGEELGLLGSEHFAREAAGESTQAAATNPHAAPAVEALSTKFAAYLNFDMVGRFDEALSVQGAGSSTRWASLVEARNVPVGLPLQLYQDAYLPTDSTAFYLRGVPILTAWTGVHGDYHTPTDTADKLDYARMAEIARLFDGVARNLANDPVAPDYLQATRPSRAMVRTGLRAYLGTIPDYASEVRGLRLSGVVEGGPAAEGGLQSGDVVTRVAGRAVENIYDYTYALEALEIGEPCEIVVQRDGRELRLTIVPASRD